MGTLETIAVRVEPAAATAAASNRFDALTARHGVDLAPRAVATLQVNLTKLCNQACKHYHVDASPARRERLSEEGVQALLEVLASHPGIHTLDLTGGAPELHPAFEHIVITARALGREVIVRHNLTVQFDGNPETGADMGHLPDFFAAQGVQVVCSLPYYDVFFTDSQRGKGVFDKSIDGLRRLNAVGYGQPGTGLSLHLVYNPAGAFLPAAQAALETDFKRELQARFGLVFNQLFTITNMPINRFRQHLAKAGQLEPYLQKLEGAFNPAAASNVMCRDLISVGCEGQLYDCDFNQQTALPALDAQSRGMSLFDFDLDRLLSRRIRTEDHCLGCSAGSGSSCGGATA